MFVATVLEVPRAFWAMRVPMHSDNDSCSAIMRRTLRFQVWTSGMSLRLRRSVQGSGGWMAVSWPFAGPPAVQTVLVML